MKGYKRLVSRNSDGSIIAIVYMKKQKLNLPHKKTKPMDVLDLSQLRRIELKPLRYDKLPETKKGE